ncbi:hypothetical protein GCM10014713_40770 [Streptomyces purpureus]|uniref:Uncharacterized protein n=1 Tax=Streptomyces purpureus TaxID=1951 RepID=A0A918LSC2_9ACTN|nr:hypothetical protein GCM10014713_40770 [Streptomyces purpureus]
MTDGQGIADGDVVGSVPRGVIHIGAASGAGGAGWSRPGWTCTPHSASPTPRARRRQHRDLYDAGVRAGELTEPTEEPLLPWHLEKADALARIAAEVRHLSRLPDSGDVCWLTVP